MPQGAKNGDFRNQFPILTHNFPAKCMDFTPSNAISLHLIVSKMAEKLAWQRFYLYSASPNYVIPPVV
jgi:hypothetical protein